VLSHEAGCGGDGHGRDKRHGKGLEQEREAGPGPCPRHIDEAHAAIGTVNTGDARMQERLVLEEIQMPPGRLRRDRISELASKGHPSRFYRCRRNFLNIM
jgi:hypothetical protein